MIHTLGVPRRGRDMMVIRRPAAPAPSVPSTVEDRAEDEGPIDITPFDFQGMLGNGPTGSRASDQATGNSAIPLAAASPSPAAPTPTAPLPSEHYTSLLEQFAPIAKSVLTSSSAEEDVQVLKAQIKNHRKLRDSLPEPFKTIYANKVRVLEAKLRAAEKAKVEENKTQTSRWEWASLGKSAIVVGILAGSALTALLITTAIKTGRK